MRARRRTTWWGLALVATVALLAMAPAGEANHRLETDTELEAGNQTLDVSEARASASAEIELVYRYPTYAPSVVSASPETVLAVGGFGEDWTVSVEPSTVTHSSAGHPYERSVEDGQMQRETATVELTAERANQTPGRAEAQLAVYANTSPTYTLADSSDQVEIAVAWTGEEPTREEQPAEASPSSEDDAEPDPESGSEPEPETEPEPQDPQPSPASEDEPGDGSATDPEDGSQEDRAIPGLGGLGAVLCLGSVALGTLSRTG